MSEQNKSWKSQVSFVLSMLFHGGAIALIALGPSFIPQAGLEDGTNTQVEFTASSPDENSLSDITPIKVSEPAKVKEVLPAKDTTLAPQPVAVKKTTTKKAITNVAPQPKVEPQPVLAAENDGTPVNSDESVVENEESKEEKYEPLVVAEPIQEEPVEKQEEKTPTPSESVAKVEEPKPKEEALVKPPEIEKESPKAEEKPASSTNSLVASNGNGANGSQAATAQPATVTQNYLELRQLPGNKPPTYSRDMRMKSMQGRGQLVYYVNRDGKVSQARITKSTGSTELDQAAVDAFSKYKFVPGQDGYTVHDFEFSLKGPAISDTGRLRTTSTR